MLHRLPLYKDADAEHKRDDPNTGLLFERFFDQFNTDASDILESKTINGHLTQGNNFWLQKFKSAGNSDALQDAAIRQMNLVKQLKGKHNFFNSQWHFVTGTGYPHPVENGLLWHPVHGVPYLSGAAVKGLVRAWVEQWTDFDESVLFSWFGNAQKDSKEMQTGDVIFFDALPVKEVRLVTDIMTPHYGEWYSKGGTIKDIANEPEKVPADWHDPKPIPFLVVDKDTSYLFSIAPRNAQAAEQVKMDDVIGCLTQALEWLGAGAKTATGYGQMLFNKEIHDGLDREFQQAQVEKTEKLRKDQADKDFIDKLKALSPVAQSYFIQINEQNWQNDKNAFWQSGRVEHWLDTLEKNPDPSIIESIKVLMNKHFEGLLTNPDKVEGKKKKPAYTSRQKEIANRVNKL